MSWLDFFQGLPMIFFRTEGAVILWAAKGSPYWQSLLFSLCWTSLSLIITYYGTGILVSRLKKWWLLRFVIAKWEKEITSRKNNFANNNSLSHNWLSLQKQWVVIILAFLPYTHFVPGLGSAVIATAKVLNIRCGIILLILGNAFRWAVITYHIYQGVHFLL